MKKIRSSAVLAGLLVSLGSASASWATLTVNAAAFCEVGDPCDTASPSALTLCEGQDFNVTAMVTADARPGWKGTLVTFVAFDSAALTPASACLNIPDQNSNPDTETGTVDGAALGLTQGTYTVLVQATQTDDCSGVTSALFEIEPKLTIAGPGSITVKKKTKFEGDTTQFGFHVEGPVVTLTNDFSLQNGEETTFGDLQNGTYSVTETVIPEGWYLKWSGCWKQESMKDAAPLDLAEYKTSPSEVSVTCGTNWVCLFVNDYDDGDGVDSETENGAPNDGDGNNDGTLDAFQGNVASLPAAEGDGYITIEIPGDPTLAINNGGPTGCGQLNYVTAFPTSDIGTSPETTLPFGLVSYKITCETATVKITYHAAGDLTGSPVLKYGPVPPYDAVDPAWYEMPATVEGNSITLELADGALGDDTGDDGVIDDAVAVGVPAVPMMPVPAMLALMALLAFAGIAPARRRAA